VAVNFRVNSAVLSPEAKRQLDDFATKAESAKAYMIEVAGHTDSIRQRDQKFPGLSRERADAVVSSIWRSIIRFRVRRFVTPMGYGKTDAVADNSTPTGRSQNRRVEVKMLLNRGLSQQSQTSRPQP